MTQTEWWTRRTYFTARGVCGWCAEPFMRPLDSPKGSEHPPVQYCCATHRKKAMNRRAQIAAHRLLCPHPDKRTFINEAVARFEAQHSATNNRGPLRAYRCDCFGWHLTSQPARGEPVSAR